MAPTYLVELETRNSGSLFEHSLAAQNDVICEFDDGLYNNKLNLANALLTKCILIVDNQLNLGNIHCNT